MNAILTASCPMFVQFYDVDLMQVVWHGHYPRFFEEARRLLLEKLNYNYHQMLESGYLWPVVELRIKYIRPLKLHQKFIVEANLIEYENRLKIEYLIRDEESLQVLTKAHSIQIAVRASDSEMQYESPEVLLLKVREALQ